MQKITERITKCQRKNLLSIERKFQFIESLSNSLTITISILIV